MTVAIVTFLFDNLCIYKLSLISPENLLFNPFLDSIKLLISHIASK